ncbi:hypothetical protein GOP47_0000921 [Adiantum capillus-veneris]|uniref:Uncharacterized protein n=1 Tax=Adiantum capillus-veneris TaxID=13818 RepID=A0A9D4VEE7_ADICA|nr:hypothetical protein GOP47_0000921 [Adiantum capillus-veneris]
MSSMHATILLDEVTYVCILRAGAMIGPFTGECMASMDAKTLRDEVMSVCILKACTIIGAIHKGAQIQDEILRQWLLTHHAVLGGAPVDVYAQCGVLYYFEQMQLEVILSDGT